ncbi:MAG: hypothetical protein EBZ77_09165, partial [Chitinophagia bacterium]|nr:hypothetical protein [Chitinophagia bacterium]
MAIFGKNNKMKKQSLSLVGAFFTAITLFCFTGCSKVTELLNKSLEMRTTTVDFVIPPTFDTTIAVTGMQTNTYNVDSFIKASTAGALGVANISSAKIKACTIHINNATPEINFQNFKSFVGSFHT